MKTNLKLHLVLLLAGMSLSVCARAQGTAFTYQGRLTQNGVATNGVVEFQFTLWNADSGGTQVASATPLSSIVNVTNGLFMVPIDFGINAFDGAYRYLQIDARTSIGPFVTLTPRQKITATPYALLAGKLSGVVTSSGLGGTYGNAVTFSNAASVFHGTFTGNGGGLTNLNAATVGGLNASSFWKLGGNAGTTAGVNFLGTTDNQALELMAYGSRALRIEPASATYVGPGSSVIYSNSPNIISGAPVNGVGAGVLGASIGGGGVAGIYSDTGGGYVLVGSLSNYIAALFSTIGGGIGHTVESNADAGTIAGGYQNLIQLGAYNATIGGGYGNKIGTNARNSVVAGGSGNQIRTNAAGATIAGGADNMIRDEANNATIGGGFENIIFGRSSYATIPGGRFNEVSGRYSFAAGHRAKVRGGDGCFVWADSTDADFASTGANQFLIRAAGGVGIGTPSPVTQLDVRSANSSSQAQVLAANNNADTWVQLWSGYNNGGNPPAIIWPIGQMLRFLSSTVSGNGGAEFMRIDSVGNVGIGRGSAANKLEVEGNASKTVAGSWLANSDARIKTSVRAVTHALDKLDQVRPVEFRYTDEYRAQHPSIEDRPYLNVIAQEFEKVFPEAVKDSGDKLPNGDPILQVDTYPLTIYSAAAIRELNNKLKVRDAEIETLKERLERLEQTILSQFGRKLEERSERFAHYHAMARGRERANRRCVRR